MVTSATAEVTTLVKPKNKASTLIRRDLSEVTDDQAVRIPLHLAQGPLRQQRAWFQPRRVRAPRGSHRRRLHRRRHHARRQRQQVGLTAELCSSEPSASTLTGTTQACK